MGNLQVSALPQFKLILGPLHYSPFFYKAVSWGIQSFTWDAFPSEKIIKMHSSERQWFWLSHIFWTKSISSSKTKEFVQPLEYIVIEYIVIQYLTVLETCFMINHLFLYDLFPWWQMEATTYFSFIQPHDDKHYINVDINI